MYSQCLVPYETHDAPQPNLGHPMRAFVPSAVLTANNLSVSLNMVIRMVHNVWMTVSEATILNECCLIYDTVADDDDDDGFVDGYDVDFNLDLNFQTIDCFQIWFCDTLPFSISRVFHSISQRKLH